MKKLGTSPGASAKAPPHFRVTDRNGAIAVRVIELADKSKGGRLLYIAASAERAEQLSRVLQELAPELGTVHFPPWDSMPYDRTLPSRTAMGRRVGVLHQLAHRLEAPRIVVSSPDALIQRVPPRKLAAAPPLRLKAGDKVRIEKLQSDLLHRGYTLDQRVDEPGEAALRGKVIDVFPATSATPIRLEYDDSVIYEIRQFDPASQLTGQEVEEVTLYPAVEYDLRSSPGGKPAREVGPWSHEARETFFDYVPDATLIVEAKAESRRVVIMQQIAESFEIRKAVHRGSDPSIASPKQLYLDDGEWSARVAGSMTFELEESGAGDDRSGPVPNFALEEDPDDSFAAFVKRELKSGRRVVATAANDNLLSHLRRRTDRLISRQTAKVEARNWREVGDARSRSIVYLKLDLEAGFVDRSAGIAVIAAADLLGSRARQPEPAILPATTLSRDTLFRIGDSVVHLDHGMGLLRGLDTVKPQPDSELDAVALEFAKEEKLLAPIEELDRIWPYGASPSVALDRLGSDSWSKRRAEIEAEIATTARRFVDMARQRATRQAPRLIPPRQAYEAFVARFPFAESPDQLKAIAETLDDLASGHPMDRLVCGDVGFGKTEVALRAAAAAALSGKQVAVVAPTTVLASQHLQTFQRRFAGFGIDIALLSRAATPSEAGNIRTGLKKGRIGIVIATHALLGRGVAFKDLGLVVIDEEQRFGAAQKARLRELAKNSHVLTLTATPIPRTLQAALVGLQELSLLTTPPVERRPVRTVVTPMSEAILRDALMRERRRGGQSFVVCPRIQDIGPMEACLAASVPDLERLVVHGKMPPEAIDEAMLRFAAGAGDVLLTTNIVESGLDLPMANTMLIWRADRFGLAQLHQLRGRVGRSRLRGVVYLLTDPKTRLARATVKRLEAIEQNARLGAGFDISSQDLDLRGAGTLLGEEQAGHIKAIGAALYRHLFDRAVETARGAPVEEAWSPELNIAMSGRVPDSYVPEAVLRIDLYARLARLSTASEIEGLRDEIEDRFGPLPSTVDHLFARALLKRWCREAEIMRIDAGPQAIAFTFRPGLPSEIAERIARRASALAWSNGRLLYQRATKSIAARQRLLLTLLRKLRRLIRGMSASA
jgi:transcription-repair coupling factor (superfamily II helicase)